MQTRPSKKEREEKKRDKSVKTFRINCGGKYHRMTLNSRGHIAFPDHEDFDLQLVTSEARGEPTCACVRTFWFWTAHKLCDDIYHAVWSQVRSTVTHTKKRGAWGAQIKQFRARQRKVVRECYGSSRINVEYRKRIRRSFARTRYNRRDYAKPYNFLASILAAHAAEARAVLEFELYLYNIKKIYVSTRRVFRRRRILVPLSKLYVDDYKLIDGKLHAILGYMAITRNGVVAKPIIDVPIATWKLSMVHYGKFLQIKTSKHCIKRPVLCIKDGKVFYIHVNNIKSKRKKATIKSVELTVCDGKTRRGKSLKFIT